MNINIIAIGKLKEKYWQDAVKEYSKRLGSYCTLQITELKESPLRANPSSADEQAVKDAEGKEILRRIRREDYVITLEIRGKGMSSEQLAAKIEGLALDVPRGEHTLRIEADNRFGEDSALHIPNDYYAYGGINRPVAAEEPGAA